MKHLKPYNEGFFGFGKKKPKLSTSEFIKDVTDILLDIRDDGCFHIDGPNPPPTDFQHGYKYQMRISITKIKKDGDYAGFSLGGRQRKFDYEVSEISETVLRLIDYCGSVNVEMEIDIVSIYGLSDDGDVIPRPTNLKLTSKEFKNKLGTGWQGWNISNLEINKITLTFHPGYYSS